MNGLEAEFAGAVAVLQLNAAEPENLTLMEAYGVRGHPALVVVDENGRVAARFVGVIEEAVLREAVMGDGN